MRTRPRSSRRSIRIPHFISIWKMLLPFSRDLSILFSRISLLREKSLCISMIFLSVALLFMNFVVFWFSSYPRWAVVSRPAFRNLKPLVSSLCLQTIKGSNHSLDYVHISGNSFLILHSLQILCIASAERNRFRFWINSYSRFRDSQAITHFFTGRETELHTNSNKISFGAVLLQKQMIISFTLSPFFSKTASNCESLVMNVTFPNNFFYLFHSNIFKMIQKRANPIEFVHSYYK